MKHLFIILKKNAEVAKNFLKLNLTAVTAKRKAFNNFFFLLKKKRRKLKAENIKAQFYVVLGIKECKTENQGRY